MSWPGVLVLLLVGAVSVAFSLLQFKMLWTEGQDTREQRRQLRAGNRRRDLIHGLGSVAVVFGAVGLAFYLGWRMGDTESGLLAAIVVTVCLGLVVVSYAIRTGWVSQK